LFKNNPFYLSLLSSIIFLITYFALSAFGLVQEQVGVEFIGQASRWCETLSDGLFREPVNTLSNLGFMVAGLYIFWIISNEETNSNNEFFGPSKVAILYASAALFLGPGSMLMHGTNTLWGGWADNLSMIMYIIIPWLYNVYKMSNWSQQTFIKVYLSIIVIYSVWRWFTDWGLGINFNLFSVWIRFFSGFVGFIVLALFGILPAEVFENISEYWWILFFWLPGLLANSKPEGERTYIYYLLGMVTYFAAFFIWSYGVPDNVYCKPDSLFQAHGIWHLLSAIATYFFFLHYRSEKI
jgi:hypothetical protein